MKFLSLLASFAGLGAVAPAQDMIAVSFFGDVYTIDSPTGVSEVLGPSGFMGLNSFAQDSSGLLLTSRFGPDGSILSIDPATGAATFVVATLLDIRGLAFSDADVLFAIVDGGDITQPDQLVQIDLASGSATPVGSLGATNLQSLAFGDGSLFSASAPDGLAVIDPETAQLTFIDPFPLFGTLQSLTFDRCGRLFGANTTLFEFDPKTGRIIASTPIVGANALRGVELMPPVVERGAPSNPDSYVATPITLGADFIATVDLTTTGHDFALVFGFQSALATALPGGQILLSNVFDPRGEIFGNVLRPGPVANFRCPFPADATLCGVRVFSQALHVGGVQPFALSNSQDLLIGM